MVERVRGDEGLTPFLQQRDGVVPVEVVRLGERDAGVGLAVDAGRERRTQATTASRPASVRV